MRIFYIIVALASIPFIFLTMYLRTSQGLKQRLGSFFVIRKFESDYLKVRSLKDILLLLLRLVFAVLIVLLIFNPTSVDMPGRNTIFHDAGKEEGSKTSYSYNVKLIAPPQAMDKFDEDKFFLSALVKNYKTKSRNVSIVYNPSEKIINSLKGNIIIFPHKKQAGNAFLKWVELFDLSSLRIKDAKIEETDINVKACYPILVMNSDKVKKLAELEDGTVIAVSFAYNNGRVLLFGTGASGFWGDIGVSGYFVDIIDAFINNISMTEKSEKDIKKDKDYSFGEVTSLLSFDIMLKIASFVFLLELIIFIIKTIRTKKIMLIIFALVIPVIMQASRLYAEDFRFIELTMDGQPGNSAMFQILKHDLEEKTSVRISPNYYAVHSAYSFLQGKLPDLPYLWIIGCANTGGFSEKLVRALSDFVERGGIIFIDLNYANANSSCRQFYEGLALKIAGNPGLARLSVDHPIYKSFYLMNSQNFTGADVSLTTKRSAIILSENNLKQRILNRDENALKSGVNIVLYMLSGNYKSDQIHTRQILNRLKKRELFR